MTGQKSGCIRRLLARVEGWGCTHGSESRWIPKRVEAAGVGEEGSLGALPVAWHGIGGVQKWCGFEFELVASIYRRSEGVAVNGVAPASDYGEAEVGQGV